MVLPSSAPLFAYKAPASPCASPATSTDSRADDHAASHAGRALSPSTLAKLPGLQFAIAHRRTELRLPSLAGGRGFDQENVSMNHSHSHSHLTGHPHIFLSMPHCESPHYLPGVPQCPETSPLEKKTKDTLDDLKKRKKGTRRGTLNAEAKNVLKAWMFSPEHFAHPYPSEEEKEELALEAGIEVKQLSNWFTNARKRLWQPVLRQSGVEVKNFLSTGRGGPRGNKLDVPANLQHLIAQREAEEDASPPSSPVAEPSSAVSSLKRSWSEMHSSPAPSSMPANMDEVNPKKKKSVALQSKRTHKDGSAEDDNDASTVMTETASQLSHELRMALAHRSQTVMALHSRMADPSANNFKDIEILAAASLIGLHHQQFQPVH